MSTFNKPVLEVMDLTIGFNSDDKLIKAVNKASFSVSRGETVCLVGESGAGKSVSAFSVMQLLGADDNSGRIEQSGQILFESSDGRVIDLLKIGKKELQRIRGKEMSMIYQEPMNSLNPVISCGNQIAEVIRRHSNTGKTEARIKAQEALQSVGISDAKRIFTSYPHELSGGMLQRVMIAMATVLHPVLLIADEPTTAVDVTIQAQILNLFQKIQQASGTAILFITHDISVVAQLADRVVVMYAGRTIESGSVMEIFKRPLHPYTMGFLNSIPNAEEGRKRLVTIPGTVPNPAELPEGCSFHRRCQWAKNKCSRFIPAQEVPSKGRTVMCWFWREIEEQKK